MKKKFYRKSNFVKFLAIGGVCFVALSVGVYLKFFTHSLEATPSYPVNYQPPEMKLLFAETNPDKQAKIVRDMAEKYGPRQALTFMEHSGLPYTGATHLLVHEIGEVAYEKYGENALPYCDESFLAACYHGAILDEVADNGMSGLAKMVDACKTAGPNIIAQCSHAAGHGFLAIQDYHVLQALPLCDQLNKLEPLAPVFNCYDGVFMENIFGVHDGGTSPNRMIKPSDPNYPCDMVPVKYRGGCWADQASLMYELFKGDLRKVAEGCDALTNTTYKTICYGNFAREIHPMSQGNADVAVQLCQNATGEWKDECLITIVDAAFSVGDKTTMPYKICADMVNSPNHAKCYQELYNNIASYGNTPKLQSQYCNYILEDTERQDCNKKFNVNGTVPTPSSTLNPYTSTEFQSAASATKVSASEAPLQGDMAKITSIAKSDGIVVAYTYLKKNWSPDPVRGHDLAHTIGQLAYEKEGLKGFAMCDSAFGFGCYHGLLEVLLKDKGAKAIPEARKGCEGLQLPGQIDSCLHGIGHGIMADADSVGAAINTCKTFPVSEQPYCFDGSFMEYYTGTMVGRVKNLKADFNKPWDFCSSFSENAKEQCIRNDTLFLLYSGPDSFPLVTKACDELGAGLKSVCLQTAGLYSAQMANGNTAMVGNFCTKFYTKDDQAACFSAAAQEFIFENKTQQQAKALCSNLDSQWKETCEQGVQQMATSYGSR